MEIIKRDYAGHEEQYVDFIDEGTPDKERVTLAGGAASFQILTGSYEGLEIRDKNGKIATIRTDTVTSVQVLPAAATAGPFTTQALKDLLKEFFFFDVAGEAGDSEFINFGMSGENDTYYNPLSSAKNLQNSTIISPDLYIIYPAYITDNATFKEIALSRLAGGPANARVTMGFYNFAAQGNLVVKNTPKDLIYQAPEFVFTGGAQVVKHIVPEQTLTKGWYYVVMISDSNNIRFKGSSLVGLPQFLGYAELGTAISQIGRLQRADTYSSILPNPFPQTIPNIIAFFGGFVPPVPFLKR